MAEESPEDRRARRDAFFFFDDVDLDGNNAVSEAEIVSSLPTLISPQPEDPQVDLEQSRKLAKKIIQRWDPDFFVKDDVMQRELKRDDLVEILMLAYKNNDLGHYLPGSYADRKNALRHRAGATRLLSVPLVFTFFVETIKMLLLPIGVWWLDFRSPFNRNFTLTPQWKMYVTLVAGPFYFALYFNGWLWIQNDSDIRNAIKKSEFGAPLLLCLVYSVTWNFARLASAMGPFKRFRVFNPRHHARYRRLRNAYLPLVYEYDDPDDSKATELSAPRWRESSRFETAYDVYVNIFNIVGHPEGFPEDLHVRSIMKESVGGVKDDTAFSYLAVSWSVLAENGMYGLVFALIHPVVRSVDAGSSKFWGLNGAAGTHFMSVTSFFLTWLFITLFLVSLDRQRYHLKAFQAALEVCSAVASRPYARRVQFFFPRNLRFANVKLITPHIPLNSDFLNLMGWNEIRLSLIEEFNERITSAPLVFIATAIFIMLVFAVSMLTSLFFFFERASNGFRWMCFYGALLFAWRLSYYFDVGEDINHTSDEHVEILSNVKLELHMAAEEDRAKQQPTVDPKNLDLANLPSPELPPHESKRLGVKRMDTINTREFDVSLTRKGQTALPLQEYDEKCLARLEHAALVSTFIDSIKYASSPYMEIFGWKIDKEFESSFASVVSVWVLVVASNFFLQDLNI